MAPHDDTWFCPDCGDGPYGQWFPSCMSCNYYKLKDSDASSRSIVKLRKTQNGKVIEQRGREGPKVKSTQYDLWTCGICNSGNLDKDAVCSDCGLSKGGGSLEERENQNKLLMESGKKESVPPEVPKDIQEGYDEGGTNEVQWSEGNRGVVAGDKEEPLNTNFVLADHNTLNDTITSQPNSPDGKDSSSTQSATAIGERRIEKKQSLGGEPLDVTSARLLDEDHIMAATEERRRGNNLFERMLNILKLKLDAILIAADYMEPPLKQGFTRLRWQCNCGDKLYGDVFEYHDGGIARMVDRMQRSLGIKVAIQPSNSSASTQRYTFRVPNWMRGILQNLASVVRWPPSRTPCLPTPNQGSGTTIIMTPKVPLVPEKTLHLMVCMQRGRYRREIDQSRIDGVTTDRELFCFMKSRLRTRRGLVRRLFSLRCVQGLFFVKFRLRSCNSAEVRDHEPCCTSSVPRVCECIPPAARVTPSRDAEYECDPPGPLDTYPPVMSRELMHMLSHPELIDEHEDFVLKQIPKRTKGELISQVGKPVEGWGISCQEGWDPDSMMCIIILVFVSGSLIFAILWSHYKFDMQGAFGASSYVVAVIGIMIGCIVNRAEKSG